MTEAAPERRASSRIGFHVPASFVAGAVAFVLLAIASRFHETIYNNYNWMADAWLHGVAYLPHFPGDYIDAIPYHGHAQLVEAPMPGVLMLPFVMIWGPQLANQTLLAMLLGAVAVGATWLLCQRMGLTFAQNVAMTGFVLFGTSLFFCAMLGDVWFIAHVSAVAFTMVALAELAGERRGWIVAFCACAAGLSRFPFFVALPFYFVLIRPGAVHWWNGRRGFLALALVGAAAWVWDNEARWGTVTDIGLAVLYHMNVEQSDHLGSAFNLGNLPKQMHAYFTNPPNFYTHWPWVGVPMFGMALQWTSPALLVAFFARGSKALIAGLWTLTIGLAIPEFIYFSAGDVQYGMRHALDFEPYLFVLMILALRGRRGVFLWPLFAYSIGVGVWAMWFWQTYPPGTQF